MTAADGETYAYAYAAPSALRRGRGGLELALATTTADAEPGFFFEGRLLRPRTAAEMMLSVAAVARARFYVPPSMLVAQGVALADPVITTSPDRIRMESFSACASVYARLDLDEEGFEGNVRRHGTTNVDFQEDLRTELTRVRDDEPLRLAVGAKTVAISRGAKTVTERKVPLPARWIRGFAEVHAVLERMRPVLRASASETRAFLRGLPRARSRGVAWVVRGTAGLSVTHRATPAGVAVGGLSRLLVLDRVATASGLVVYAEPGGASAWTLEGRGARLTLALTPEPSRGFSGEGTAAARVLDADDGALARVRAGLTWQSRIDVDALAREHGLTRDATLAALAALGSRGVVGYDQVEQAFFHRELPWRKGSLEAQPRVRAAKKLAGEGAVRFVDRERLEAEVTSGDVIHRVRVGGEGGDAKCSCTWYAKHGSTRGPCKHVLAVRVALGEKR